jgi:hypothetical protein
MAVYEGADTGRGTVTINQFYLHVRCNKAADALRERRADYRLYYLLHTSPTRIDLRNLSVVFLPTSEVVLEKDRYKGVVAS